MMPQKSSCTFYKYATAILLIAIIVAGALIFADFSQKSAIQSRKNIVAQIVEQGLETGNIEHLIDKYLDPNIELEYPPNFNLPPHNTNKVSGIENAKKILKTWKSDTEHQVDIIDIISEGDTVVLIINMDRVFIMDDETIIHEDHPAVYFFKFAKGKIVKITCLFDVIEEVEKFKEDKY